jgi:hypothetical protein
MKLLRPSEIKESTKIILFFKDLENPSSGFSFQLNKDGSPPRDSPNYQLCLNNPSRYRLELQTATQTYKEPALWECACGTQIECPNFTNICPNCGTYYNWAGQELNPPEMWGEETGEQPSDILRIR